MEVDLTYLKSLMGNDNARTEHFLEIYKSEVPVLISKMESALEEGDLETLTTTAHGIKTQSAYLMAEEVVRIARDLEHNADNAAPLKILRDISRQLIYSVTEVLNSL